MLFVLLFGRGRVLFFAVWAGDLFFFAVWAGGVGFFCCMGGGVFCFCSLGGVACLFFTRFFWVGGLRVFFSFAVWVGDGSSLTYRSAWLVFKRPNNKKDQTANKKKRVPVNGSKDDEKS